MKISFKAMLVGTGLMVATQAQGAVVTFVDSLLGNGSFTWSQGGVDLTLAAAGGGTLSSIPGTGGFAGAWLGAGNTNGVYTLSLSQAVTSFELEFDALSSIGTPPPETISNITTNPGGATLSYTDQGGTTFDGSVITSTQNDGQGTILLTSLTPFTSVTFTHTQGQQSGFVIERVTINTDGGGRVPDAGSSLVLFVVGMTAMAVIRRRA